MSKSYKPPAETEPTGLEEESVSTSQEVVPLPVFTGERKLTAHWITKVYKQFTKEAPLERPGKK